MRPPRSVLATGPGGDRSDEPRPDRSAVAPAVAAFLLVAVPALLVLAALAPEPVVLGAMRLAAFATAATGASLVISRTGAADLAVAAAVAVGAYAGGVAAALLALPVAAGLPLGAAAGAAVGAASGAMHGRLGQLLGALTSLTLGGAVVAVLGAWSAAGGVAGFHAVGLPTPWGDRADLVGVGLVLLLATSVQGWATSGRWAAAAGVSVHAPAVAAALGHQPALAAARTGAVGGALLGLGGVSLAAVDGSVLPGAYGVEFTAALALAALLGGPSLPGPLLGTLLVWGPGTIWPLVPLVGTAPPLLLLGPVGLVVLALRRGRPLLPARPLPLRWARLHPPRPRVGRARVSTTSAAPAGDTADPDPPAPRAPPTRRSLVADGLDTPAGRIDLHLEPGEVVALIGPNGAGKSTALARLGGQLLDGGAVRLGGRPAPRGATARARLGVARTWQRAPDVPSDDVEHLVVDGPQARSAARWASDVLAGAATPIAPLVWVAARGPAVALLDEPTDVATERLIPYLRGLADAGTAVLVVDHRPEVAAAADRVVVLGEVAAP